MRRFAAMKCNGAVGFVLLLLLAGSGCAALIYEIVWLQLLQLMIQISNDPAAQTTAPATAPSSTTTTTTTAPALPTVPTIPGGGF